MGSITRPPGSTPAAASPGAARPPADGSPLKIVLLALGAVAALVVFLRPAYLPGLPLGRANAQGSRADGSATPVTCRGTEGCLVVYVAPWCGPCRASLAGDVALADRLRGRGYETVFVVGMDKPEACLEMVRSLGREARLDPDGRWAKEAGVRGVPHFLVTAPSGKIKKRQAGAYQAPPDVVARLLGIG